MLKHTKASIICLTSVACLTMTPPSLALNTWYVDDDAIGDPGPGDPSVSDPLEDGSNEHPFDAIQEAILAAANGDTVVVLEGRYTGNGNRDISFANRAIDVRSENGPQSCVIDCEGAPDDPHRGFEIARVPEGTTRLDGFTVTGGYHYRGGAILCGYESNAEITRCVIVGNTVRDYGGGIHCRSRSRPTISNCLISENRAEWLQGGGVYCDYDCGPTIVNCTISKNTAGYKGGGVYSTWRSVPVFVNCTIIGNTSETDGGGICCSWYSQPAIANCVIAGNTAYSGGGGVASRYYAKPSISNSVFTNNHAAWGGGLACTFFGEATLANSVLWEDTPGEINGAALATYCVVLGGWSGVGNIDADPLFIDADGPDDDPNTLEDNNYRLAPGSPCIDAGCTWAVMRDVADLDEDGHVFELTPLDLDDDGRFYNDPNMPDSGCGASLIVDIGAYELGGAGQQPCVGDFNSDSAVDLSDLEALLLNYGVANGPCAGDLNCDGNVGLADLATFLAAYQEGCN